MSLQYLSQDPLLSFADFHRLFEDTIIPQPTSETHGRQLEGPRGERVKVSRNWPRMDVYENPKENDVKAMFELPGLRKEDVTINITGNRLIVSGECNPQTKETDPAGYICKERQRGKFSRSLPIPVGIKSEQIKAQMQNGLLIVTYPKTSPEQQAKRIQIS